MQQIVLPIKDSNVLKEVQDTLLHNFRAGRRNYTVFQVGKATLLRVSDILRLKRTDVFDEKGNVRQNTYLHDRKTGKANRLYLKPIMGDLLAYQKWLQQENLVSPWLFPSIQHPDKHVTEKRFYKIMAKVGDLLDLDYLGTHSMRKTSAPLELYQKMGLVFTVTTLKHKRSVVGYVIDVTKPEENRKIKKVIKGD